MTTDAGGSYWSAPALAELVMALTDETRELTVERIIEAYHHYETSTADDGLEVPSAQELEGIFRTVEDLMRERAKRAGRRLSRRWLRTMREGLAAAKAEAAAEADCVAAIGRMLDEDRQKKVAL